MSGLKVEEKTVCQEKKNKPEIGLKMWAGRNFATVSFPGRLILTLSPKSIGAKAIARDRWGKRGGNRRVRRMPLVRGPPAFVQRVPPRHDLHIYLKGGIGGGRKWL